MNDHNLKKPINEEFILHDEMDENASNYFESFEIDESLYSPTIKDNPALDPNRRVFNPATLVFFSFFLMQFFILAVMFNYYQYKRWNALWGSVLFFYWTMISTLTVAIYIIQEEQLDPSFLKIVFRGVPIFVSFLVLFHQKKLYRWFELSDGVPLNGFKYGLPVFLILVFTPIGYYSNLILLIIANTIYQFFIG